MNINAAIQTLLDEIRRPNSDLLEIEEELNKLFFEIGSEVMAREDQGNS